MTITEIFGVLAVIVGMTGQGIYIATILQGKTRPHLFTWLVWTILGGIGFAAMVHDNAGPAMMLHNSAPSGVFTWWSAGLAASCLSSCLGPRASLTYSWCCPRLSSR